MSNDATTEPQKDTRRWYRVKISERRKLYYRVFSDSPENAANIALEKCEGGEEPFDVLDLDAHVYSVDAE